MTALTSLEAGLLVTSVEFALLACGIACCALRRGRSAEQQQVAQVAGLVHKVDATTDTRRAALSAVIAETYRFDAEETERVVTDFIERERAFYNAMIGVHLGRSGKTLEDVPAELTKVVAPWLRLTPKNMISADTVTALENANSVLNQELASTKRVLDELMEEYNAAFHRERQLAHAAPTVPPVDTHDLLSIDDADSAAGQPAATAQPPIAPVAAPEADPAADVDDFAAVGEIIALDVDMDPDEALSTTELASGLTPNDLDALMENLDPEDERRIAAA